MTSFLNGLDPNLVLTLFSLLGAGATWLYKKAKGEKTESIQDSLWHVLEGVAYRLADDDTTVSQARAALTKAAYEALERFGVKRTVLVEGVVAKVVDRGVTEVVKRVLARKNAAKLEAAIVDAATKAHEVRFESPATPTVPVLGFDVEIVK